MRLSTLNQTLADAFANTPNADALFQRVFWKTYESFDMKMKQELEAEAELACLAERQIPSSDKLATKSESFDEHYFDLEDKGHLEASGRYFQKARITAAMAQASRSSSNLDFAEAAYEALMATDDPHSVSVQIVSQIA